MIVDFVFKSMRIHKGKRCLLRVKFSACFRSLKTLRIKTNKWYLLDWTCACSDDISLENNLIQVFIVNSKRHFFSFSKVKRNIWQNQYLLCAVKWNMKEKSEKECASKFLCTFGIYSIAEVGTAINWNPLSNDEHFALEIKLFPHTNVMWSVKQTKSI